MRTFAHKPESTQKTKSTTPANPSRAFSGQRPDVRSILHLQRTIGNQALQQILQADAKKLETGPGSNEPTRFAHDFSRIPIFRTSPVHAQPKLSVNATSDNLHVKEADRIAGPDAPVKSDPVPAAWNNKRTSTPDLHSWRDKRDNSTENRTGMSDQLKAGLESLSGLDLSGVRIHRNSPKPDRLDALAYTQGQTVHLAPNQDKHLPHEGWHVVQQLQGRVKAGWLQINNASINNNPRLEAEADLMGDRATNLIHTAQKPQRSLTNISPGNSSKQPVQREVRINGGRTRVNEADYLPGGSCNNIGSRYTVVSLIGDNVRRVFNGIAELEGYANGQTDYIGDVITSSAGTFWYRLPENDLTVLGEMHHNPGGNVEDVILGLQTSRFMYEPFHEFTDVSPLSGFGQLGVGTETRMRQIESGRRVAGLIDRTHFDPHLENIVIKALTGATVTRTEFIAQNPATMNAIDRQTWSGRPTTSDYSYGERIALYLSMAIHIASDIAQYSFTPQCISHYIDSARRLFEFYTANQTVLDSFMTDKDNDDLVGIYELTDANSFADLPVLNNFTLKFHEYASRYIEQLGVQMGNIALQTEGQALLGNLAATLQTFSPAREEFMWERIQHANTMGYLIVGMGDAHRQNLHQRLNTAGIRHEEVAQGLQAQRTTINSGWTP